MKQFEIQFSGEVYSDGIFPKFNIKRKIFFKTTGAGDKCAHLAVQDHQLAMTFVSPRGQSAHFWIQDCFEGLSSRSKEFEPT